MGIFMSVEEAIKEKIQESKNSHVMLVEGMSKLWTHKVKTCQSSVFEVSGHKWKLIVYPAGINGTSDHVSIYLRIKDKKSLGSGEVQCCVKLHVAYNNLLKLCHGFTMYNVRFNAKQAIHGKDFFMAHWDLRTNHMKDDKVIFGVEISNVRSNCAVNAVPRTIGTAERLKLEEVPPKNSRHSWKVKRFSSYNGEHSSHEFTVGPRRWKLMMFPNGADAESKGYLSVCLAATGKVTNGPMAKTLAVYKLRLLNQLHHKNLEHGNFASWYNYDTRKSNSFWGPYKFLPLEQLKDPSKGHLVKDVIYLSVDILLVSTTEYL